MPKDTDLDMDDLRVVLRARAHAITTSLGQGKVDLVSEIERALVEAWAEGRSSAARESVTTKPAALSPDDLDPEVLAALREFGQLAYDGQLSLAGRTDAASLYWSAQRLMDGARIFVLACRAASQMVGATRHSEETMRTCEELGIFARSGSGAGLVATPVTREIYARVGPGNVVRLARRMTGPESPDIL